LTTSATLVAVTKRAADCSIADGRLPRASRALVADSIATIISALCGTSTVVSYIESASGVEAGGRHRPDHSDHGGAHVVGALHHAADPGDACGGNRARARRCGHHP